MLGSDRAICLHIFDSIPEVKQPRILNWFQKGGPDETFNWQSFLDHVKDQFENKQVRKTITSQSQRMRMGYNQYFVDFLQEFELKLSQCGVTKWDDYRKISILETGIKSSLRDLL